MICYLLAVAQKPNSWHGSKPRFASGFSKGIMWQQVLHAVINCKIDERCTHTHTHTSAYFMDIYVENCGDANKSVYSPHTSRLNIAQTAATPCNNHTLFGNIPNNNCTMLDDIIGTGLLDAFGLNYSMSFSHPTRMDTRIQCEVTPCCFMSPLFYKHNAHTHTTSHNKMEQFSSCLILTKILRALR